MKKTAIIDPSGRYRYLLTRIWDEDEPSAVFIMLNPSTADADRDDPTIRRCADFARRWRFGGLKVVNVFAFRATDPEQLKTASDPIGPENHKYIRDAIVNAGIIIAAWGVAGPKNKAAYEKVFQIAEEEDAVIHCLGVAKGGTPRHPLYLPALTMPKQLTRGLI